LLGSDLKSQALSLVQSAVAKQVLGPVLTSPITGSVTGGDIAALLNSGQQMGIFHLGESSSKILSATAGASQLPPGVQQLLALRTQAAAPVLDGASISNAFAQNRALGLSTVHAHAASLDQHGVALFKGNGAGVFTKVPSSGLPGL
jgi:hypothetical protein